MNREYRVRISGHGHGAIYSADSEQSARDMCARDAGYEDESSMLSELAYNAEVFARPVRHDAADENQYMVYYVEEITESILPALTLPLSYEDAEDVFNAYSRSQGLPALRFFIGLYEPKRFLGFL